MTLPADIALTLDGPWLIADLGRARRVLSFAPYRPGFVTTRAIVWRQVRDADLTEDFDVDRWFHGQLAAIEAPDCVAMLTSRGLAHHVTARAGRAICIATVGLGNAERVGHLRHAAAPFGTINLGLLIDGGMTDTAMIEALTIAAEARTAAVIDTGLRLPTGLATGTGTDCIALAADPGETRFAGLHTELGRDIGAAVYGAVLQGGRDWMAEQGLS